MFGGSRRASKREKNFLLIVFRYIHVTGYTKFFFFFCSASWVVADRRPTRVPLYCRRKEPKQEHYVGMPDDFEVETTVTYEILENIQ